MDWNGALAAADATVAGVFDRQVVQVRAKSRGFGVNSAAGDDPERAAFVRAVSIELEPQGFPTAQRHGADPASQRNQVFHEAVMTAHVADWPWLPLVGDMVVPGAVVSGDFVPGAEKFVVASVQDDPTGRPAFYLNRAG